MDDPLQGNYYLGISLAQEIFNEHAMKKKIAIVKGVIECLLTFN